jgi:membrane associated rhomboid family serine protease
MRGISDTIKHLILINILFFVATQIYGDRMVQWFGLWYYENPNFRFWQPITHMFMHGGFAHILFNMYGLWAFGSPLERMWGRNKFLFFYFSAGIGAAILHTVANYYGFQRGFQALVETGIPADQIMEVLQQGKYDTTWETMVSPDLVNGMIDSFIIPAVGASGAVYGILVAFAFLYPNVELMLIFLPIPIKAKIFVPLLILGDLFFGFSGTGTGIAHFAHIGGALVGFIMMWYWKNNQFNNNRWDR